jgi:PPOX class probable F420-dependent enzyme
MPSQIPESYLDLLTTKKAFAHLATIMPDGSPQVTPVWIDYDGEYVLVNSAAGRRKDKNMAERPSVSLSILDPDNNYRYMALQGRVVHISEEGAKAHIDKLAQKYWGKESYNHQPGEVRRIYKIQPERVWGMG